MPNFDDDAKYIKTLSDFLFYHGDPRERKRMEKYRIEYEKQHGPTDLTRRYTSTLPAELQEKLLSIAPDHYFQGLPPYMQSYFRDMMTQAAANGELDLHESYLIRAFVRGAMKGEGRDR